MNIAYFDKMEWWYNYVFVSKEANYNTFIVYEDIINYFSDALYMLDWVVNRRKSNHWYSRIFMVRVLIRMLELSKENNQSIDWMIHAFNLRFSGWRYK